MVYGIGGDIHIGYWFFLRFYLVLYSSEFTVYLCYIISMYDVQKDLNMISEQANMNPWRFIAVAWIPTFRKKSIQIQLRLVQMDIQSNGNCNGLSSYQSMVGAFF